MEAIQVNSESRQLTYAGIMSVFAVLTVLSNTVGVKIFTLGGISLPVSVFWLPLTFLLTDLVSEIYGEKRAYLLVVVGFSMSILLLLCATIGRYLPTASFYQLGEEYERLYRPTWRLLFASMFAYLLAQSVDVRIFHFLKKVTGGRYLWLRNNGSTFVSQFVDTVTVNWIFLYANPDVFTGTVSELWTLIFQVYFVKLLIALFDTPLFYLGVWGLKRFLSTENVR